MKFVDLSILKRQRTREAMSPTGFFGIPVESNGTKQFFKLSEQCNLSAEHYKYDQG